jgi:hypothetical protein
MNTTHTTTNCFSISFPGGTLHERLRVDTILLEWCCAVQIHTVLRQKHYAGCIFRTTRKCLGFLQLRIQTLYVQNAIVVVISTVYLYSGQCQSTSTWRYCQKIDSSTHLESLTINRILCPPLLRLRWRIRKTDANLDFFNYVKDVFPSYTCVIRGVQSTPIVHKIFYMQQSR